MYKPKPYADVRIGTRGTIVIPAAIRANLGLCEGDTLFATVDDEGRLVLKKVPSDPLERVREANAGIWEDVDPTAFFRALRDEWSGD